MLLPSFEYVSRIGDDQGLDYDVAGVENGIGIRCVNYNSDDMVFAFGIDNVVEVTVNQPPMSSDGPFVYRFQKPLPAYLFTATGIRGNIRISSRLIKIVTCLGWV